MKKSIPFLIPLLIGIIITGIIISLNICSEKTQVESSYQNYPDSLTTHFPGNFGLSTVTVSKLPFQSRKKLGLESVLLSVSENNQISEFVKKYETSFNYDTITQENVFNIKIDIKDYCLASVANSESAKYPFPDKIRYDEYNKYDLIFYEYSTNAISDSLLNSNNKIDSKWKHGFSRGIARDSKGEYNFWLMIW